MKAAWQRYLACCFAGIFGFRAYCIEHYGASIPWIDDWEAIGQKILAPWRNGTLTWAALFEAHNGDHRIVATRLWEILWYEINGAWDPKLVMTAKAAVFAAAAVIFIHVLVGRLARGRFVAGAVLALLFAFPFSHHNLLWSFQSQFDFFLLAAALAWWAFVSGRRLLALLAAAFAPFTLAAGPLIALSFLPFVAVETAQDRAGRKRALAFASVAALIVVLGILWRPGSDLFPPGPPSEQVNTFLALLGWPHSSLLSIIYRLPESAHLIPAAVLRFPGEGNSWLLNTAEWFRAHPGAVIATNALLVLLVLAPVIGLMAALLRRRMEFGVLRGLLGVGVLALLLQAATAHSRSEQTTIVIRYLDIVALGGFVAIAAAFYLNAWRPRWRSWLLVWAVLAAPPYLLTMAGTLERMSERRPQAWVANVRQYFPSHDPAVFRAMLEKDRGWPLPVRDDHLIGFIALLDDPEVEAVLPWSLSAPERPLPTPAYVGVIIGKAGLLWVLAAIGGGVWIVVRMRRSRVRRERGNATEAGVPVRV